MSGSKTEMAGDQYIGTRVDEDTKTDIRLRAAQLGFESQAEYFRHLLEEDLEGVDFSAIK